MGLDPRTIVDAILCDSPFCASGGRKSKGRRRLNEILQTKTQDEVALELRCSRRVVSYLATGQRRPGNWRLVQRIKEKLGIEEMDWEMDTAETALVEQPASGSMVSGITFAACEHFSI